MTVTKINVSPQQYIQTVAGNVALKISYNLGKHAANFGRRDIEFYLQLAESTKTLCLMHSAPFTGKPAFLSSEDLRLLQENALLAVSEIVTSIKQRMQANLNSYLTEAAAFWRNSQSFLEYRHTAEGMPSDDVINIILDSSDGEYVSRIDQHSLRINEERFQLPASKRYFKETGTKLIYDTLKSDDKIRSLINIGGRIDPSLYFAANKFPDRKFMSFDFQHNLREQNRVAFGDIPPNMHFGSGYALDALSHGLKADAVYFMATSVLFTVKEMTRYAELFARNGFRKVIISESWASPIEGYDCGEIVPPEAIDVDRPFLGGTVLNVQHNYIAILERAGYRIEKSEIVDQHFGGWYNILQIVATLEDAPGPSPQPSSFMQRLFGSQRA